MQALFGEISFIYTLNSKAQESKAQASTRILWVSQRSNQAAHSVEYCGLECLEYCALENAFTLEYWASEWLEYCALEDALTLGSSVDIFWE